MPHSQDSYQSSFQFEDSEKYNKNEKILLVIIFSKLTDKKTDRKFWNEKHIFKSQ